MGRFYQNRRTLPHFPLWNRGRRFVPIHPSGGRSQGPVCRDFYSPGFAPRCFLARAFLFWVLRRHVVVFFVRMRKIFPFGVPRGTLTVHIAPSKLSPICKSPGRALRTSDERESVLFQPAPNRNILRILAQIPTRWPLPALLLFRTAC